MGATRISQFSFRISLLAAVVLFFAINSVSLKDGHNWGDDFSQYILHAENILNSRAYDEGIQLVAHVTNPPGFPLLLVPLLKVFGLNFVALKSLNLFFWAGSVLVLIGMIRRRIDDLLVLCIAVFLLSSPWFFLFKQNVLSDVPFLFFTVSAIAVYDRQREQESSVNPAFFAFAILLCAALSIRAAGGALALAALCDLAWRRRWVAVAVLLGTIIIVLAGEWALGALPRQYVSFITTQSFSVSWLLRKFVVPLKELVALFIPVPTLSFLETPVALGFSAGSLLLLAGTGFLVNVHRQKGLGIIELFSMAYVAMMMSYTTQEEPRFFLPLFGLTLFYVVLGLDWTAGRIGCSRIRQTLVAAVLTAGIVYNLAAVTLLRTFDNNEIYRAGVRQMFGWVRDHIPANEHYLFFKPRVLALTTGRVGQYISLPYQGGPVSPATLEEIIPFAKAHAIQWIILKRNTDDWIAQYLLLQPEIRFEWKNEDFCVLSIAADPPSKAPHS